MLEKTRVIDFLNEEIERQKKQFEYAENRRNLIKYRSPTIEKISLQIYLEEREGEPSVMELHLDNDKTMFDCVFDHDGGAILKSEKASLKDFYLRVLEDKIKAKGETIKAMRITIRALHLED